MDVITCSYLLMVVSFILTPTKSDAGDFEAKIDIYDPNGNPTSLIYDGGEIRITCIFDQGYSRQYLLITGPVNGTDKMIRINAKPDVPRAEHSESLNYKVLHRNYACVQDKQRTPIVISYVLCNPKIMPPIDCMEPREFCHITAKDTPQCRRLQGEDCLSSKISLKFKHICSTSKGELETYGLCSALAGIDESDIISVASNECKPKVTFYLIANSAARKRIIYLNRRAYVNVRYPFTIGATADGGSFNDYSVTLNTTVGDEVIFIKKISESDDLNYTLSEMVKKIKEVDRPANTSITCRSVRDMGGAEWENYFSAQLLVFNPEKDLHINIIVEKPAMVGDKALKKISVNVTAAEGLFACVKEGIGRCAPVGANRNEIVKTILEYKPNGGKNYTMYFYAGLFTSSPKKRHVLLYHKIIRHTVQGSAVPAVNAGHSNTAGLTAGLVILSLICIILLVVVVMSMLWWRSTRSIEKSEAGRFDPVIREKADTEHQSQYGITNTKSYSPKKSNRFASATCETFSG